MIDFYNISNGYILSEVIDKEFRETLIIEKEHPLILNLEFKNENDFIGYFIRENGIIIGIIYVWPFHSKEAYSCSYNFNVYLKKAYRKNGYMLDIYDTFESEICQSDKIKNFITSIYSEQYEDIKWLEKRGFKKLGCLTGVGIGNEDNHNVTFLMKKLY